MSSTLTRLVRTTTLAAGAGALVLAAAGPAAAHHCYKENWTESARVQLATGKTAWMPVSDLVAGFLSSGEIPGLPEACADHADEFVADWMDEVDLEQEPMIHSRATVGGGAAHHKGFEPKPFSYLSDADFDTLLGIVFQHEDCQPPAE